MTPGNQTQVFVDRPESVPTEQLSDAGIKTILFHVDDDSAVMDRLQLTLSLARACGAHVHCLHVTPIEAYTVVDTFGGTFVSSEIFRTFEQRAAELQQRIETQLTLEDVNWDYEEVTGELVPHLVQSAALADVIITGREARDRGFDRPAVTLLGDLLARIRAPLLVASDGAWGFDPFAPAVIAWNGSYEAANAVRAALPILKMASKVMVVQFSEERDRRFPSTVLVQYLSRHGIFAELEAHTTTTDIDRALVSYSERQGAGIIVMGGYSHSRAGEFLFGGVTRALLMDCPIALLIAH